MVFLFLSLRNEYSCRSHCGQTHGNEGVWSVPDNRHVLPQLRHCQPHDTRRGSRHRPEESQRLEGHSSASFKEHVTRIAEKKLDKEFDRFIKLSIVGFFLGLLRGNPCTCILTQLCLWFVLQIR